MSRRKTNLESNRESARVDDILVRGARTRDQVRKILSSLRSQDLSVEGAHRIAQRIRKKGPAAVRGLFDLLFEEGQTEHHRLATMLLSEMNDPTVLERIHNFLARPQLPERVRVALLAIEAIHEGGGLTSDTPVEIVPGSLNGVSVDSLLAFTETFWESMEMEEVAMMWRENFINEPVAQRLAMLDVLMKAAHPKTLGIARLEITVGDLPIVQFLAQKLGEFENPLAGPLLQLLLGHPDVLIRTTAEESLSKWAAGQKQSNASYMPRFYRAYMATDEWAGHYSVVYAVKVPDETIKFTVVLLDRWDRGIIDCWGCVRYSEKDFEHMLENMAGDFRDLRQERINKKTALTLLYKAGELNNRRKHRLPLEYHIWAHLFEHERVESDPKVPEFGVVCGVCQKPVRTGPRIPPPWVFGDFVVCHRCSKNGFDCPHCGGSVALADCVLTQEGPHVLDLHCPHCYNSFQMQT